MFVFQKTTVAVVSIVTKIRILKQITTNFNNIEVDACCIYSNKDKNFKANHNISDAEVAARTVVSIVTKIRILKQITTATEWHDASESCIYSNKDKNFKANHNIYWCKVDGFIVVSIVTKIRILKQITTLYLRLYHA